MRATPATDRLRPSLSPGSDLTLWQAQLKDRPPALPMLPFASRGFRDPDTSASFNRYEQMLPQDLTMNLRMACMVAEHTEMHFGLVAFQILLMHLTGAVDLVVGIGRTVVSKRDVVPIRFQAGLNRSLQYLLDNTKATLKSSRDYSHVSVKALLSALDVSRQHLLHQVSYDWLTTSFESARNIEVYFRQPQDLV
ncbi:hypothetical protein FB567DRAFT_1962 [Paraphoma chrysanthemicola]|uniref:Uncharacterized protein n=1 Tax=Paraphoma chrysanthemicola TaxID=798071 RepID=A0A8K0RJ83_9PLEO|nr:hypothetical protein FB567DRAFT_1962 [Paraphoma chrysanthemicola]